MTGERKPDGEPDIYVITEDWGPCRGCGNWEDRRGGWCFICATNAEQIAEIRNDG